MNVLISGLFQTKAPLSHISESISTTTYLVEDRILQPDGQSVKSVFAYSGNAWRGHLRDLSAVALLMLLGAPRLRLPAFQLLFSGGSIGGEQKTDLAEARRLRRQLSNIALFGGGVGNQILSGKINVSSSYPLCREAIPALPEQYHEAASRVSYSDLTFQKSFSRCDDEKNVRFEGYLPSADDLLAETPSAKGKKAPAEKKEQATQQRLTAELLAVGVSLYSSIIAIDLNELELGCLLSALEMFSYCPMIGGQRGRGHGLVSLDYTFTDLDAGASEPLVTIPRCGAFQMSVRAQAAQSAYRHQVMAQREALLDGEGRQSELGALLLEAA